MGQRHDYPHHFASAEKFSSGLSTTIFITVTLLAGSLALPRPSSSAPAGAHDAHYGPAG